MAAIKGPNASVQAAIQGATFGMSDTLGGVNNSEIVGWNCAPNSMALNYLPPGCE